MNKGSSITNECILMNGVALKDMNWAARTPCLIHSASKRRKNMNEYPCVDLSLKIQFFQKTFSLSLISGNVATCIDCDNEESLQ